MSTPLKWEMITTLLQNSESQDAFYVGDSSQLDFLYKKWVELLPQVSPYYAVKCNPDRNLISRLAKFPKMGFDCASISEISMVLQESVETSQIIYSNTSRQHSHLAFAGKNGLKLMSFDSECELLKIKKIIPDAQLVLRISVEEMGSMYSFKDKYGVNLDDSQKLLKIAKELDMQVVGLCFHVGCSAKNPKAYYNAIKDCKKLFNFAKDELNLNFSLLNLGGGYSSCFEGSPTDLGLPFERVAKSINDALDKFFPPDEYSGGKLKIIAEPGRYFSQSVYSLCVSVFNKKKYAGASQIMSADGNVQPDRIMYYVNQGIYSAFSCVFWDHKAPFPRAFYTNGKILEFSQNMENSFNSTIWGPTCDGGDWVFTSIALPELEIGDWIIWDNIGAYSSSIITNFNGFSPAEILWID